MPISVRLKQQKTPGHFLPICKKVPGVLRHMQFFVFFYFNLRHEHFQVESTDPSTMRFTMRQICCSGEQAARKIPKERI